MKRNGRIEGVAAIILSMMFTVVAAPAQSQTQRDKLNLSGEWKHIESGSVCQFEHEQNSIVGKFTTVAETLATGYGFAAGDVCFKGTLSELRAEGQTEVHFPVSVKDTCPANWRSMTPAELTVSADGKRMEGKWLGKELAEPACTETQIGWIAQTYERVKEIKGVCGPDVTKQLTSVMQTLAKEFDAATPAKRRDACNRLVRGNAGYGNWDIVQLALDGQVVIKKQYPDMCAVPGKEKPDQTKGLNSCDRSVEVDGGCHYAGAVNYVSYGLMFRMCTYADWKFMAVQLQGLVGSIDYYKGPVETPVAILLNFLRRVNVRGHNVMEEVFGYNLPPPKGKSDNFPQAVEWAVAGYKGWPGREAYTYLYGPGACQTCDMSPFVKELNLHVPAPPEQQPHCVSCGKPWKERLTVKWVGLGIFDVD